MLPKYLEANLERLGYARSRPLGYLPSKLPESVCKFYEQFEGPFSGRAGFILLDLDGPEPNVFSMSRTCWIEHGWPEKYLVLTDYLGGGVLVLDSVTKHVYDVDFEGADVDLVEGRLVPSWETFDDFLVYYFGQR